MSRRVCLCRLLGVFGVCFADATFGTEPPERAGKILLVRGLFTVFSLGLDNLAKQLKQKSYDAEVVPACLAHSAFDAILQKYATGQLHGPLVLIGHSFGGDLLPGLANQLAAHRRSVDLLVMIDSTFPSDCPSNVRRCVNLYQSNFSPEWFRFFRGAPIRATNPTTELVNVDIRKLNHPDATRLDHFNIEASQWIHDMVINEVVRVMTLPMHAAVDSRVP